MDNSMSNRDLTLTDFITTYIALTGDTCPVAVIRAQGYTLDVETVTAMQDTLTLSSPEGFRTWWSCYRWVMWGHLA